MNGKNASKSSDLKSSLYILKSAKTILLIDWQSPSIPRALIKAGFTVFSYSPRGYSRADIFSIVPEYLINESIFPPSSGDAGYLVFQKLKNKAASVDIVNVYRPAAELHGIFNDQVIGLAAKTLWLQPPVTSLEVEALAKQAGIIFVENINIAEVAMKIR